MWTPASFRCSRRRWVQGSTSSVSPVKPPPRPRRHPQQPDAVLPRPNPARRPPFSQASTPSILSSSAATPRPKREGQPPGRLAPFLGSGGADARRDTSPLPWLPRRRLAHSWARAARTPPARCGGGGRRAGAGGERCARRWSTAMYKPRRRTAMDAGGFLQNQNVFPDTLKSGPRVDFPETAGLFCKTCDDGRPEAIGGLLVGKDMFGLPDVSIFLHKVGHTL